MTYEKGAIYIVLEQHVGCIGDAKGISKRNFPHSLRGDFRLVFLYWFWSGAGPVHTQFLAADELYGVNTI